MPTLEFSFLVFPISLTFFCALPRLSAVRAILPPAVLSTFQCCVVQNLFALLQCLRQLQPRFSNQPSRLEVAALLNLLSSFILVRLFGFANQVAASQLMLNLLYSMLRSCLFSRTQVNLHALASNFHVEERC
jgi:hypothetical protein